MKKEKTKNKADTKKIAVSVIVIAALAIIALSATTPPKPAENAGNKCDSGACPINTEESVSTSTIASDSKSAPETTRRIDDSSPMDKSLEKINEDLNKARLTQTTVTAVRAAATTIPSAQETNPINTPDKSVAIKSNQPVSDVMEVIAGPEAFIGSPIGVKGTVMKTYPEKLLFTMGCSCRQMTVEYSGKIPSVGSTITTYGQVVKQNGGYVFKANSLS